MAGRPKIPHDPPGRPTDEHNRGAKRWIRKLAEAGKLSGRPVKQIPLYRMKPEPPEDVA